MRVGSMSALDVGKQLVAEVQRDDAFGLAAELAYRFFLALFPFMIFLTALGGFIASALNVQNPAQQAIGMLQQHLPPETAQLVGQQLQSVIEARNPALLSVGILGALWAAAGGFNAVIKAMNRAYDVEETRPFWKKMLLAVGLTVLAGTFVVVAFLLLVVATAFGQQIAGALGLGGAFQTIAPYLSWVLSLALLIVAAAFIYWAAPNMHLPWKWITPGAVLFVVGWLIGTFAFTFYVANFGSYNATYGALGGVVVLLLWFYLTGALLVVGAELNAIVDEAMDPAAMHERRTQKNAEAAAKKGKAPQQRKQDLHERVPAPTTRRVEPSPPPAGFGSQPALRVHGADAHDEAQRKDRPAA